MWPCISLVHNLKTSHLISCRRKRGDLVPGNASWRRWFGVKGHVVVVVMVVEKSWRVCVEGVVVRYLFNRWWRKGG